MLAPKGFGLQFCGQTLTPVLRTTYDLEYHLNMPIDKKTESEIRYQLALIRAPHIASRTYKYLIEKFGSAEIVFENKKESCQKLKKETVDYLYNPPWEKVEHDLRWLEHIDHHFITLYQPDYPFLLDLLRN